MILAGTGPVGQRAAVMLAKEGVSVAITSRTLGNAQKACDHLKAGDLGIDVTVIEAPDLDLALAYEGAQVVLATGAASLVLLRESDWKSNPTIRYMADANATPPLGIEGMDMMDRGIERDGRICWGATGLARSSCRAPSLHRAVVRGAPTRCWTPRPSTPRPNRWSDRNTATMIVQQPTTFLDDLASGSATPGGGMPRPSWVRWVRPWSA